MWTSVPAGLKVLALLLPRAAALSRSLSPPPLDNLLGATAGRAVGAAAGTPQRRDETCPVRSEGGTRRVQLVREGGGQQQEQGTHSVSSTSSLKRSGPAICAARAGQGYRTM